MHRAGGHVRNPLPIMRLARRNCTATGWSNREMRAPS